MADKYERIEKIKDDYRRELRRLWKRNPLVEKRDRSRRMLMRVLSTLKSEPKLFIALSIDRRQYPTMKAGPFSVIFEKFKKIIQRKYPEGWFIWKVEWDDIAQLHVHMLGDIRIEGVVKTTFVIKKIWDQCCQHKDRKFKSVDVQRYKTKGAKGYFIKKIKRENELTCIINLENRHMYGYINPGNIKYCQKIPLKLSEFEFQKFHTYILKVLENEKPKREKTISHFIERFPKEFGVVNFICHELMRKAYTYIKILRKKIFGLDYYKGRCFSENQYRAYMLRKIQRNLRREAA